MGKSSNPGKTSKKASITGKGSSGDTAINIETLCELVKGGKIVEVRKLVKNSRIKEIINSRDNNGNLPLFYALDKGENANADITKMLINSGADINNPVCGNNSPLFLAGVKGCSVAVLKCLLSKSAKFNKEDNEHNRVLFHVLAVGASIEIVKLLLNNGADPNGLDKEGNSPLLCALRVGASVEIVKLLLDRGTNPKWKHKEGDSLLFFAVSLGTSIEIMEMLISFGADPNSRNKEGKSLAMMAVFCERIDVLTACKRWGNFSCELGDDLLYSAAYSHRAKAVKFLLESKDYTTNVKSTNPLRMTPLHAVCISTKNITEVLVSLYNVIEVHYAASHCPEDRMPWKGTGVTPSCLESARALCLHEADINALDSKGNTPLHYAVEHMSASDCKVLIKELGADPKIKNRDGKNVLHIAVEKGSCDVVKMLLGMGMNIEEEVDTGDENDPKTRPLHLAAIGGNVKIVDLLLQRGANPHALDRAGFTPRQHANLGGHEVAATRLLEAMEQQGRPNPDLMDAFVTQCIQRLDLAK